MSLSVRIPTSLSPSLRTGKCRMSRSLNRSIAFFIESFSSTDTGFRIMRFATIMAFPPVVSRRLDRSGEVLSNQVERSRQIDVGNQKVQHPVLLPEDERVSFLLPGEEGGLGEQRRRGIRCAERILPRDQKEKRILPEG